MARSTIIVVVLFLVLAGGVFALERTNPQAPENPQVYVLEVPDTDVQRLDVRTSAGTASFERADPFGWSFAGSGNAADLSRVSSVVNRLAKLRSSSKVGDNVTNLSPYGLTPAPIIATLTMKDGTTRAVQIGNKTVNDAAYYALVEGTNSLHTINTLVVGDIEKLVTDPPVPTPTPDPERTATPRPTSTTAPTATRGPGTPDATPTPLGTIGLPGPSTR